MTNPYESANPKDVRRQIREGKITGQTSGMCSGYAQANMAVLSKDLAFDFLLFCERNKKPCPLLDVTEAGSPEPRVALRALTCVWIFPGTEFIKKEFLPTK